MMMRRNRLNRRILFLFDADELVIEENLPAGSIVGQFFVTGGISDDTEVEYSLNSNADIFEIDENGTLPHKDHSRL